MERMNIYLLRGERKVNSFLHVVHPTWQPGGALDGDGWSGGESRHRMCTSDHLHQISLTTTSLFATFFRKQAKIKLQAVIHPVFIRWPLSMSALSTWRELTGHGNLRVQHCVCSRRLWWILLCTSVTPHLFLCRLAQLGQSFPPKSRQMSAGQQRGKKKKRRRSISRPGFQAEIAEKSTALFRSHHIIPNPRFSEIFHMGSAWLRAFMSCAFHLLIAKNGNGSQKRSSDQRPSPFNSIQRQLI